MSISTNIDLKLDLLAKNIGDQLSDTQALSFIDTIDSEMDSWEFTEMCYDLFNEKLKKGI